MITAEQGPAKTDGNIQRHSVVKKKDPAKIAERVQTAEQAWPDGKHPTAGTPTYTGMEAASSGGMRLENDFDELPVHMQAPVS